MIGDSANEIEEFAKLIAPLPEHVSQPLLDRFECLLGSAVVEFSEGSCVLADGTRQGGISLRVVGMDELIVAARAAA